MEIFKVNKPLAFILPVQSMNRFPFIHCMTVSLAWTHRRSILASKFRVNAVHVKKQLCLCMVSVSENAFKVTAQLGQGFQFICVKGTQWIQKV